MDAVVWFRVHLFRDNNNNCNFSLKDSFNKKHILKAIYESTEFFYKI